MSPLHTAVRFVRREAARSSRTTGLFAIAVLLVVALGTASELPQARAPRAAATGALTPAMQAATLVDGAMNGAATWFVGNRQTADENQQLQEENRRLAAQLAQLQATERQNAQLRAELGLRHQDQLLTTGATVVAHDPDGLGRTLTIDHGSRSGVRPGMAVIAAGGMVGLVRSVTGWSAQVETTAEPGFAVGVVTAGTGLTGTVEGRDAGPSGTAGEHGSDRTPAWGGRGHRGRCRDPRRPRARPPDHGQPRRSEGGNRWTGGR